MDLPDQTTPALLAIDMPGLTLRIGGIPETCLFSHDPERQSGWAVLGTGIQHTGEGAVIMTGREWGRFLEGGKGDFERLDGHFIVLQWNDGMLECRTDQLGLRTLYYAECPAGMCISSRLDWVARVTEKHELDLRSLGSGWLLANQMEPGSYLRGVTRLGAGGRAVFTGGSVQTVSSVPWNPSGAEEDVLLDALRPVLGAAFSLGGLTPSLGLSGGLDSRFLLAMLLEDGIGGFRTHSVSEPADPDVLVAGRIATALGLAHTHFDTPLPDAAACVDGLRQYAVQTNLVEPCSSYVKLRHYATMRREKVLMIDGGFGEVARRKYMNRVLTFDRTALQRKDARRIAPHMMGVRADIFNDGAMQKMREGALASLQSVLDGMPDVVDMGAENFADLFIVRTRVQNYGGPEQSRTDAEIMNYMPLIQPSYLRAAFAAPLKERKDSRMYRETIEQLRPDLTRYPLVKGRHMHRFETPTGLAWLTSLVKTKAGTGYIDETPHRLLIHIREFVQDTAGSAAVRSFGPYDPANVRRIVDGYYAGNRELAGQVTWWLTFELWRDGMA